MKAFPFEYGDDILDQDATPIDVNHIISRNKYPCMYCLELAS